MKLIKYNLPQVLISYKFRHRGAENCGKSVLIINCTVLSSLAGWYTNYKNMHDINNINFPQSKSWTFEDFQEKDK
jgi:benzoyl-CoA reductase/2-hydroxyglutaryl-CoA dehydratase subunit BcrC/BadD/HgdB